MGIVVRALTLAVPLTVALSCSFETETHKAPSRQVTAPPEAALDATTPEVGELLEDLLARAQRQPQSGLRRGELGMAYEVNGFPDAALTSYRQAEALDESNAKWPYFQALILARRGEEHAALKAMERSIAIDSGYAPAWLWRGKWSLDLGYVDDAYEAFGMAEALGGGAAAIVGQALVSLHEHEPNEAIALLEPLSKRLEHPNVFHVLGRAYREAGRFEDARTALARFESATQMQWEDPWQESKRVFEGSFEARASTAYDLLIAGEPDKALEILESLISQRPDDKVVINHLSYAYDRVGEEEKAFQILRNALMNHPDHYLFHYNIVDFYARQGDFDSALIHVNRAIELNSTSAVPYTRKGLLLMDNRKWEQALSAFESALRYDRSDPEIFLYAGQMAATLKRWPHAIQRFEQSVRIDPSFTLGHINLAGALAYSNRFEEARAALERARELGTHEQQVRNAFRQLAVQEARAR